MLAVLVGIGFWMFPMISDDLHFQIPFRKYIEGREVFDWDVVWNYIVEVYHTNNIRIPNVITPFLIYAKNIKMLPAVISTIALWYVSYKGLMLAGVDKAKGLRLWFCVAIFFAGILFCFPWIDQMYLFTFQMNYLWPTAISLFMIDLLVNNRGGAVVAFLLGLVLGFWHEAFAGPMLVAILGLSLLFPMYRNFKVLLCVIGLASGLLWFMFAPAMGGHSWPYFQGRLYVVLPYLLPWMIYVAVNAILLRRDKDMVFSPRNVMFILLSSASMGVLVVYSTVGARIGSIGVVVSIIGVVHLLNKAQWGLGGVVGRGVIILLLIFEVVHVIVVDVMCWRLGNQTEIALQRYRESPTQSVFAPMDLREDAPWLCFQKPYYDWFAHRCTSKSFEGLYGIGIYPLMVVPETIAEYKPCDAEPVPGSAGVTYYKGHVVGSALTDYFANVDFAADYGQGVKTRRFYVVSFRSEADGKMYAWYHPENTWMDHVLNPRPLRVDEVP